MINHHEAALHHYFTDYTINNQNCTTKTDHKNAFVAISKYIQGFEVNSLCRLYYKPGLQTVNY